MNKKRIVALGLIGTMALGSIGAVGAEYASQRGKVDALVGQLGGIAQEYKHDAELYKQEAESYSSQVQQAEQNYNSATAELQYTIEALRGQIRQLGSEPCQ